jgi:hypothetical protein
MQFVHLLRVDTRHLLLRGDGLTLLAGRPLDRFGGTRGTAQPEKLELRVLKRVRSKEELLQLLARVRQKVTKCRN